MKLLLLEHLSHSVLSWPQELRYVPSKICIVSKICIAVSLWGQTEFQGWEHCGVHCHQSVLWTGCLAQGYNRVSSFFPSWQKLPWLLKEAQKGPLLFYKEKTLQGPLHSSSSNLISMTFYARRLLLCMIWSCILNFPRFPLNQPPSSQRRFTKLTILAASHMKRK